METKNDLDKLQEAINDVRTSYRRTSAVWLLMTVIFIIFAIYYISFSIQKEVNKAVEKEEITATVEKAIESGFDRVIQNYEEY